MQLLNLSAIGLEEHAHLAVAVVDDTKALPRGEPELRPRRVVRELRHDDRTRRADGLDANAHKKTDVGIHITQLQPI